MNNISNYSGSPKTAEKVREEIRKRFGKKAAKAYDPFTNCLTFRKWSEQNYKVKKGEKSICSITFVDKLDESGNKIGSYPKKVHLFYETQVEPRFNS
ncbi:MAG: hypothetical protein WC025_01020 [Candidatus Magasanikbacteria bacterium]